MEEEMNDIDLENRLDEKFDLYLGHLSVNQIYRAIKILGEINNCIPKLDKKKQDKWLQRLRSEKLSQDSLQTILFELEKEIKEINRLLSVSDDWIFEEIVFFLTDRIYLDFVIDFLTEVGYLKENIDLKSLDEKILRISKIEANKRSFASSVNSINKNWGLPITNEWLKVNKRK